MEVVRLGPDDLSLFRAMNRLFSAAFEDPASYESAPPPDEYVRSRLADDSFVALVACMGGEVVGALAAFELRKFEQARSELYIYDLAVAEAQRRKGVATTLIQWLRDYGRTVGAWMLYVQADPSDDPAVALYEKLGTREEVFHFDIPPTPSPRPKTS